MALIISGCSDPYYPSTANQENEQPKGYAVLGPVSGADVKIATLDGNETLLETTTGVSPFATTQLSWPYEVGSFEIDIDNSVDDNLWVLVSISGGVDVDSDDDGVVDSVPTPLQGRALALCKVADLREKGVVVNLLTTIAAQNYLKDINTTSLDIKTYLDDYAARWFRESLDGDSVVDYRDIMSFIPNKTPKKRLYNPTLYTNFIQQGVAQSLLDGDDILAMLDGDDDGDSLTLLQEIEHSTNDTKTDSDADGIDDNVEIAKGLNPALRDTDFDGLEDGAELFSYMTDAANSDSDGDYIPDGDEVREGSDPLNADENGDGVEDGIDNDPFLKYQWYIHSVGAIVATTTSVATIAGNDLGIFNLYHYVVGKEDGSATVVQVVDTGIELAHEDIDVDTTNSFNAITLSNDPTPTRSTTSDPTSVLNIGHGTSVAGIIGAKSQNGIGIRGIVPNAKIAGSNWLEDQSLGELERVWYSQVNDDAIGVSNNSWGAYYIADTGFERILALGTQQLRSGKGRVYVFAAGNSRETYGNANLSYLTNNPYVITVAALNEKDQYASYSSPGASILVSAYGGEHYYKSATIMTTTLTGKALYASELNGIGAVTVDEDAKKNYTYAMNGTSSAAPMVSASIALVLDACPALTWRDVRWLIANTAKKVDPKQDEWVLNGAGLMYNINYGYGKIDPAAMVKLCRTSYFEPLPTMQTLSVTTQPNLPIPDTNTTVSTTLQITQKLQVEWIGLYIDTDHPFAGDLQVTLVSPSGTKIDLIKPNELHFAAYDGGFRLSSVGYMDEYAQGQWRVEVTDRLSGDSGVLKTLTLEVHGYVR